MTAPPAPLDERLDEASLKRGLRELAARDAHVAAAVERYGYPPLRNRPPGFDALLRAIVGQQISVGAAASIWKRLEERYTPPLTAQALALAQEADLRACGLSRQKMLYTRSLAELVAGGTVPLDRLHEFDDEPAIAELVKIKGIGRWTAEIYLLFALGRRDVFPADDLGLMVGMQRMKRLRTRPDRKRMYKLAEAWRPWRGAGALMLWHYFHATTDEARAAKAKPA